MSTAYNHPEGGSIDLDCTSLQVTAENGHTAAVQIGPDGMRDLAKKLMTHAADFEYAMHLESLSHDAVLRSTRKVGTASQIDNIEMQDEVGRMFTIAEAIARKLGPRHGGDRKTDQVRNISHLNDQGRTSDIAAKKAGLGSGNTLEAAQAVIANGSPQTASRDDDESIPF